MIIIYQRIFSVTASLQTEFTSWMEQHVKEVIQTGCFNEVEIASSDEPEGNRFLNTYSYYPKSKQQWRIYVNKFQPALKEKFAEKFKEDFKKGLIKNLGILFGREESLIEQY